MNCIVTAGPTFEPLDKVRRMTNMSSGKLGCRLATFLEQQGHRVTLLIGQMASAADRVCATKLDFFTTTADLLERIGALRSTEVEAVYHAAAVSDFAFGKLWQKQPGGDLTQIEAGKIPSRIEGLMAELVSTPKVIVHLREFFPNARLIGWKYEVDGGREEALANARKQIAENRTNACVANGPAYGFGFGIVTVSGDFRHCSDARDLYGSLEAVGLGKPFPEHQNRCEKSD